MADTKGGAFLDSAPFFFSMARPQGPQDERRQVDELAGWPLNLPVLWTCGRPDYPFLPLKKEAAGSICRKRCIGAGLMGFFIASGLEADCLSFDFFCLKNSLTFEANCFIW